MRVKLGVERLLTEKIELVRGRQVGLVCNQASVLPDSFLADSVQAKNLGAIIGQRESDPDPAQDKRQEREARVRATPLFQELRNRVDRAVQTARSAQHDWARRDWRDRVALLHRAAALIREHHFPETRLIRPNPFAALSSNCKSMVGCGYTNRNRQY